MVTRMLIPALLLSLATLVVAENVLYRTIHESAPASLEAGGACVMPNGMGAPCTTPGALSHDAYHALGRIAEQPAGQITWLGWVISGKPFGPDEGTILKVPAALSAHSNYELGLRDDGVVVWRKARQE